MNHDPLPATNSPPPKRPEETPTAHHDNEITGEYPPKASDTRLPNVVGYEIQKELGRGGMGVVFLARHLELKRQVALKMLLNSAVAGSQDMARFLAESETLAALHHPNIVQIYARGQHEGLPFFAMEFCPGGSLADRVQDNPLSSEDAARVVELLARGVAAAHSCNILHRDLKPGNVLYAADGSPKITDFGLAKRLTPLGHAAEPLTQSGAVLGTPSYMAPEQAEGKDVGPASDVYALGAILYRVLAGRPPFLGSSSALTIQMVIDAEPVSPRQLNATVPRDLETICLKCLQKSPVHRYASAADLADDVGRYLRHEPIHARPTGSIERLWKWTKRNPARAAFAAAMILLLMTIAGASTLLALKERKSAQDQAEYNQNLLREQGEKDLALRNERIGSARLALDRGLILCEQGDIARGIVAMSAGLSPAIEAGAGEVESAIRHNLAAWEREMWHLESIYRGPHGAHVVSAQIQPKGDLVALALSNNTVELSSLTERPEKPRRTLPHDSVVLQLDFTADGRRLLTRTRSSIHLWDIATGTAIGPRIDVEPGLQAAAISPDGATVATASNKPIVRLHDVRSQTGSVRELLQSQPATLVQFRPDGRQLLTSEMAVLRRWNVETGEPLGQPMKHEGMVRSAAYSRDGKWIVSCTLLPLKFSGSMIYLWSADDGKLVFASPMDGGTQPEVLFSPDGLVYAARSVEGAVQLRRTTTGELIPGSTSQVGAINSITFSPDSSSLILGGRNGQLHFWDVAGNRPRGPILYHEGAVSYAGYAADGRTIVSLDGAIRRWQIAAGTRRGPALPHSGDVYSLCFSPDSKQLLTGSADGKPQVWSTESGERIAQLSEQRGAVLAVAFSSAGTRALTAGLDRVARVWDTSNWKVAARLEGYSGGILCAAMSPNDDLAVTGGSDGSVRLWDVMTGKQLGRPLDLGSPVRAVAFRPDGKIILGGCANGMARLWNVKTREPIGAPLSHKAIEFVSFTSDSRLAITAGYDSEVRLWDSDSGQQVGAVPAPNSFCQSVATSPDSRFILPGGFTSVIHLRALPNGEIVGLPWQHQDAIRAVAIALDGHTALTGSLDATARRWHIPTGFPIGPAMRHTRKLRVVDFSPDGRLCATGGWDGTASLWVVPRPIAGDPASVQRWAENLSGLSLESDGSVRALDIQTWRERRAGPQVENSR